MKVRCRHCGATNPATAVDETGDGTCAVCQRSLGVDDSLSISGSDEPSAAILSSGATFDPIDWSRETFDIQHEENISDAGAFSGDSRELLGSLPTDDEAIDISELLEGTSAHLHGDQTRPESSDEVITTFPVTPPTDDLKAGWRIKNPRGVVYEMNTEGDVVSWLMNQTDLTAIRVSRGAGSFQPVSEFPELSESASVPAVEPTGSLDGSLADSMSEPDMGDLLVDMNPAMFINEVSREVQQEDGPGDLELDFHRASTRHGAGSAVLRRGGAVVANPEQGTAFVSDRGAYGFPALLLLLLLMFVIGHVAFNFVPADVSSEEARISSPPPGPRLQKAIQLLEEKKYTAATQALERLVPRTKDPRVFRYLATALYKTDRIQEAGEALNNYRMRRGAGGKSK
jgi:hypothetical protein